MAYKPESDQSRIFVTSHSEFSRLHARDVQKILRERLILVHGNPLGYDYGWDLESMGRLYDVDRKMTVHGEIGFLSVNLFILTVGSVSTKINPHDPEVRHHLTTLREFHKMTTTLPNDECPPLNALSMSANRRNLFIPCHLGSLASHEVAESRVAYNYQTAFEVPEIKSDLEWSIIGSRGSVSPFHVDSEGLGTVVVVLEGSKYWIVATRLGEHDNICSFDSLGPCWTPYFVNEGDNAKHFRFEAVHLQKGDML